MSAVRCYWEADQFAHPLTRGIRYPFSTSERRVLACLAEGFTTQEAATALKVSARSVSSAVDRIARATGHSGRRMVVFAVRWADLQRTLTGDAAGSGSSRKDVGT